MQVEPLSTFGQYLRSHREGVEVNLRTAAEHVGCSHAWLGEVERGEKPPPRPRHWGALIEIIPTLQWDEMMRRVWFHAFLKLAIDPVKATKLVILAEALDYEDEDRKIRTALEIFDVIPKEVA